MLQYLRRHENDGIEESETDGLSSPASIKHANLASETFQFDKAAIFVRKEAEQPLEMTADKVFEQLSVSPHLYVMRSWWFVVNPDIAVISAFFSFLVLT